MTEARPSLTATLFISRGTKRSEQTVERYVVPFERGASVLDGLLWIRAHVEPGLAFRHSCINANVCKECVMRIDGKNAYACTERMREGEMYIEALPNKKLVRDLACETVPPKERL